MSLFMETCSSGSSVRIALSLYAVQTQINKKTRETDIYSSCMLAAQKACMEREPVGHKPIAYKLYGACKVKYILLLSIFGKVN